jgi:hypothetical protein
LCTFVFFIEYDFFTYFCSFLEKGKHYFFVKVIIDGKSGFNSAVATVTVK